MAELAYRRGQSGVTANWNGDDVIKRAKSLEGHSSYAIGLEVSGVAKGLCPVGKSSAGGGKKNKPGYVGGRLRGSITVVSQDGHRTTPKGPGAESSDVISAPTTPGETFVGTPVEYGPYVEYGTFRMYARPFLRPALDIVKGRVPKIVAVEARKDFGEYLNQKGEKTFLETITEAGAL
jgi:hypothetical protein